MKTKVFAFFRTKSGKFFGFLILLFVVLGIISRFSGDKKEETAGVKDNGNRMDGTSKIIDPTLETEGYTEKRAFAPSWDSVEEQRTAIAAQARVRDPDAEKEKIVKYSPPISFLPMKAKAGVIRPSASPPAPDADPDAIRPLTTKDAFAPYGRMIRAELVTTVDSSNIESPVIGLVTHGLYWGDKLLIPANSELHAIARPDRSRNRIEVAGKWVVVLAAGGLFPESSELILDGIALDMDVDPSNDRFALTDGSSGLRGTILTNEDTANTIKLFAATFLSGVADGVTQRESNGFGGSQIQAGTESGATQGLKAVADRYAERTLALIERDGAYVRVPAGKQFYLYIRQPIILDEAKYGATLATEKLQDERRIEANPSIPRIPVVSIPPEVQKKQIETIIRQMEIQKQRERTNPE